MEVSRCHAYLVRAQHELVEDLHRNFVEERVGNPGTVVPVLDFAQLVLPDLAHRNLVRLGIILDRDLRAHAAHRSDLAPVARLDEEANVCVHERHFHGDVPAVGEHGGAVGAAALDEAEDVIPSGISKLSLHTSA